MELLEELKKTREMIEELKKENLCPNGYNENALYQSVILNWVEESGKSVDKDTWNKIKELYPGATYYFECYY